MNFTNSNLWFYIDPLTKETRGPINEEILKRFIKKKIIKKDYLIWKNGINEWKICYDIEPFHTYFKNLEIQWYYMYNEKQEGPIDTNKLIEYFISGEMDGLTMIWSPFIKEWKSLGEISFLKVYIQEANEEIERQNRINETKLNTLEKEQVYEKSDQSKLITAEDGKQYIFDNEGRQWLTPQEKITEELEILAEERKDLEISNHLNTFNTNSSLNISTTSINDTIENKNDKIEIKNDNHTINKMDKDKKMKKKKKNNKNKNKWTQNKSKTWIYVTGLPKDIAEEEICNHFSKCGIIQKDIFTEQPRIKIYKKNGTQEINGDASICYIKDASVDLAIQILDKVEIRPNFPLHVSAAVFEQKGDNFIAIKKRKLDSRAKIKKLQQEKTLSWIEEGEDENDKLALRIVVLQNVFSPLDIERDPSFYKELESDLGEECGKIGEIEKITIFPKHKTGPVVIKYKTSGSAILCIEKMNGRYYNKRKIKCNFWDGTDFTYKETEEDTQKRVEEFGKWLENGDDNDINTINTNISQSTEDNNSNRIAAMPEIYDSNSNSDSDSNSNSDSD